MQFVAGMKKQKTKHKKIKTGWKDFFCQRKNLAVDVATMAVVIALLIISAMILWRQAKEENHPATETPKTELKIPDFDTTDWKVYQNNWYGFELKYPESLQQSVSQKPLPGSKWEYKYQFRKKETDENNPYIGFDIAIYNIKNVKELTGTEEHPLFKFEMNENETCRFIPQHIKEAPTFFSVEMYVPPTDDCYNQAFFYSIISDKYIYNIVPVLKEGQKPPTDFKKYAAANFPEFFSIASSFDLVAIKQITPAPPVVNRGTVCPAKVDNPSISSRKNKNHMDEDCCPDFDEWPKPGCAYSAKDYIIMLPSPTSGHVKSSQISKVKALLKGK